MIRTKTMGRFTLHLPEDKPESSFKHLSTSFELPPTSYDATPPLTSNTSLDNPEVKQLLNQSESSPAPTAKFTLLEDTESQQSSVMSPEFRPAKIADTQSFGRVLKKDASTQTSPHEITSIIDLTHRLRS